MSASSFDVSFLKAMRLLHSPQPDAADQIKSMLDECMAQKKIPPTAAPKQPQASVKPVIAPAKVTPVTIAKPIISMPSDDMECASLGCVVCKRVEQVSGNAIVECQECHSLYHQECHKPSLANENVKDPRFVWYCTTCTSKRKKAKLPGRPTPPVPGNGSNSDKAKEQQNPEVSPFKSWSFLKK